MANQATRSPNPPESGQHFVRILRFFIKARRASFAPLSGFARTPHVSTDAVLQTHQILALRIALLHPGEALGIPVEETPLNVQQGEVSSVAHKGSGVQRPDA